MTKNRCKAHASTPTVIPFIQFRWRESIEGVVLFKRRERPVLAMERASTSLCLVITLLAFNFLVPSNAIPLSSKPRISQEVILLFKISYDYALTVPFHSLWRVGVQRLVPLQHAGEVPWVEDSTPKPEVIVVC
jgi:hypothetical protein